VIIKGKIYIFEYHKIIYGYNAPLGLRPYLCTSRMHLGSIYFLINQWIINNKVHNFLSFRVSKGKKKYF